MGKSFDDYHQLGPEEARVFRRALDKKKELEAQLPKEKSEPVKYDHVLVQMSGGSNKSGDPQTAQFLKMLNDGYEIYLSVPVGDFVHYHLKKEICTS